MPLNPNITQWITLKEGDELPVKTILIAWNGEKLSQPISFAEEYDARAYRMSLRITRYLQIPDPRE